MKKVIPWIISGGLLFLAIAAVDSCRESRRDLREMRDRYNAQVKEADDLKATHDAERAAWATERAEREGKEARLKTEVAQYVDKVSTLTAELTELQNAEPVQPELESQPLVINLRAQIGKLNGMVSLVQGIAEKQAETIKLLELDKESLQAEVKSWAEDWEKEHALRLNAEANWKTVERKYKRAQWGLSLKQLGWDALFFGAGYFLGKK